MDFTIESLGYDPQVGRIYIVYNLRSGRMLLDDPTKSRMAVFSTIEKARMQIRLSPLNRRILALIPVDDGQ